MWRQIQKKCTKPSNSFAGDAKKGPSSWPIYTLVSTAAVACYLNGLNGDFVHDDIPAVTLNKDVTGLNPIGHVFKNDFWGTPMAEISSHKSYRPLTTLTFRQVIPVFIAGIIVTFLGLDIIRRMFSRGKNAQGDYEDCGDFITLFVFLWV